MARELSKQQLIERSIIKRFRKEIWNPFILAVKKYELIKENDKIAVCISGGKDSMLCAKLMQQLQKHSDVPFELVFLVMDPGYNKENRQKIENNAKLLNIPITVFESNIFDVANSAGDSPCYLCARMRRGFLYSKAKELGCTNTHFVTPNGLDSADAGGIHQTTARDLALIMSYAVKNKAFLHITQTRDYSFSDITFIFISFLTATNGLTAFRFKW